MASDERQVEDGQKDEEKVDGVSPLWIYFIEDYSLDAEFGGYFDFDIWR